MQIQMQIQEIIAELNIRKILMIDDELELNEEQKSQKALEALGLYSDNEEFLKLLKSEFRDDVVDELLEDPDNSDFYKDTNVREKIYNVVAAFMPDQFRGAAQFLLDHIKQFFNGIEIDCLTDPLQPESIKINEYDLIFMDYEYPSGVTALDLIKSFKLNEDKKNYLVFLSAKNEFILDGVQFKLMDREKKQEILRKISSGKLEKPLFLPDYINKGAGINSAIFYGEISQTIQGFYSGKIMMDVNDSIYELLDKGIKDTKQLMMLNNAKTIKALITDKLETEGVSETSYLVDFSLSIVKNIINKNVYKLSEIHEKLDKVIGWESSLWDYEMDKHMRHLREIQLLDKFINERFAPVDFGDIFSVQINRETYRGLLISQSCDLVVRFHDGALGRHANQCLLILEEKKYVKDKTPGYVKFRMGSELVTWNLRRKVLVPTSILDLVCINENGYSILEIDSTLTRRFTWGNHLSNFIQEFVRELSDEFRGKQDGEAVYWNNGQAVLCEKNGNNVDFRIKRISRLDYLHALDIFNESMNIETRVPLIKDPSDDKINLLSVRIKMNNNDTQHTCFLTESGSNIYINLDTFFECINHDRRTLSFSDELRDTFKIDHFISKEEHSQRLLKLDDQTTKKIIKDYGITVSIPSSREIVAFNFNPALLKRKDEVAVTK
ncbi:hypothetical protein [Paenibacillus pabuli]|uniref:hypothetical protein n=1 Tax=Paenibacillus pabuli TaxID=1472 RepID=UPI002000104C|nr:hypothetical protein [Paenibacillus pabuli]UPK44729.1 hypothetical protein KET34_04175 [Paenibacillus pabuli]